MGVEGSGHPHWEQKRAREAHFGLLLGLFQYPGHEGAIRGVGVASGSKLVPRGYQGICVEWAAGAEPEGAQVTLWVCG